MPRYYCDYCDTYLTHDSVGFGYLEDDDKHHFETMFGGGNVHVITTLETWEKKLLEVKRPHTVAILNFAATWCVPCKVMAPYYRQLSEKYPSLMFLVIDVDEMPEFPLAWKIESTPTFLFLKDGRHTGKLEGAKITELSKRVASLVDSLYHNYSKQVC